MHHITANELKTKGVSAIKEATSDGYEAIITVRGKDMYIIIPIEKYNSFREWELEIAYIESKKDIESGDLIEESVEEHIKRITSD